MYSNSPIIFSPLLLKVKIFNKIIILYYMYDHQIKSIIVLVPL